MRPFGLRDSVRTHCHPPSDPSSTAVAPVCDAELVCDSSYGNTLTKFGTESDKAYATFIISTAHSYTDTLTCNVTCAPLVSTS